MARTWEEIRRPVTSDRRVRIDEAKQAMRDAMALHELRAARGATQSGLASALGVSQARISVIEREPNLYLSTLARYVEGLGGHLELTAVFDDERVLIGT